MKVGYDFWKRGMGLITAMLSLVIYVYIVNTISIPTTPFSQLITLILWAVPVVAMLGAVLNGDRVDSERLVGIAIAIPIISLIFTAVSPVLTSAIAPLQNSTGIAKAFYTLANVFFTNGLALVIVLFPVLGNILEGMGGIKEVIKG